MLMKNECMYPFYSDIEELLHELIPAIAKRKYVYALTLIQQVYFVYILSPTWRNALTSKDWTSVTNIFSQLIVFTLAAELAWMTHYSLQTASGLTVLTIAIGVKVTTPTYISVGMLSNGFFNYQVLKSQGNFRAKMKRY